MRSADNENGEEMTAGLATTAWSNVEFDTLPDDHDLLFVSSYTYPTCFARSFSMMYDVESKFFKNV
jgi:hypothetical protein